MYEFFTNFDSRFGIEMDVIKKTLNYSLGVKIGLIFLMFLPVIIWYLFGKNKKVTPVISIRPPKGLNSVEMAYLHKGFITPKDATSMILYFATLGVLNIKEQRRSFKVVKTKEFASEKKIEKSVFANLFLIDTETTEKELKTYYLKSYKDIDSSLDTDESKIKMFLNSTLRFRPINKLISYFSIFVLNLILTTLIIQVLPNITLIYGLCFILLFVSIIISLNPIGYRIKATMKNVKISLNLFYIITASLLLYEKCSLLLICLGLIIIYSEIVIYLSDHMNKRNERSNKFLGQILGFKEFIKMSKEEDLKKILDNDPNYMYDMIPYAYCLNLEKQWLTKCFQLGLIAPYWYEGKWDINKVLENFKKLKTIVANENTYVQKREY